jgi:hypothetical protein
MKSKDFRRIALGFQDAVEAAHMGHPDFRVGGRIFATLSPDERQGMVTLTPDEQSAVIRANPDVFTPASGAWGRQGSTMVQLSAADADMVGEAMTQAWQNAVKKNAAKKAPKKKTSARKR